MVFFGATESPSFFIIRKINLIEMIFENSTMLNSNLFFKYFANFPVIFNIWRFFFKSLIFHQFLTLFCQYSANFYGHILPSYAIFTQNRGLEIKRHKPSLGILRANSVWHPDSDVSRFPICKCPSWRQDSQNLFRITVSKRSNWFESLIDPRSRSFSRSSA